MAYTQPTLSGYNSNPPPDDGSTGASNTVSWATHKNKLADPLKTFMQAVDTNVAAAFAEYTNTADSTLGDALVGVKRTATGAVATTGHVALELDAYYVCRDFGAPSDGTDGTAELQAAIDAVDDTNGGVVVIDGLIGISATGILISGKTNFKLVSLGAVTGLKLLAASTGQSTTIFGTTSIAFKNCVRSAIDGIIINGNSVASSAIGCEANDHCSVTNNKIYSVGDNAVTAENGTDNEYSFNTINTTTNSGRGLWIGNSGATSYMEIDAKIIGNTVEGTAWTGIVGGLVGGVISGNICHNGGGGSGIIAVANGPAAGNGYGRFISITGNYVHDWAGHGIQGDHTGTYGTDYSYSVLCSGNVCYNNDQAGIFISNTNGWVVDGNICANNGQAATTSGINGNMVQNCIISNNNCFDDQVTPTQDYGIYVANTFSTSVNTKNIIIQGNQCRNNLTYGIFITQNATYYIDTVIVDANLVIDNGDTGIRIGHSSDGYVTNLIVTNNNCTNNTTLDIRVDPSDALIENNVYSTSTNLGAQAFAASDATPSVKSRSFWKTANASPTTITDFDDGRDGQEIMVVIADGNTTIDFTGTNLKGNAGVDWSPANGDHLRCRLSGTTWYCEISDNTA